MDRSPLGGLILSVYVSRIVFVSQVRVVCPISDVTIVFTP